MKTLLLGTASVVALTLGVRAMLRPARQANATGPHFSEEDTRAVTRQFLLYFIIPLWLAAGIADWLCHRATHIETTSGVKETLIHLAMLIEMGIPVLAGLFLEINSPILALMIASFFVHEATALWDVSYAMTRREVTPIEQHVHSFLEMLPLMAVGLIAVLHWPKLQALVGLAPEGNPGIRLKQDPLPARYVATTLGAVALFEVLPYLEELWRDWRANPGYLIPPKGEPYQVALTVVR